MFKSFEIFFVIALVWLVNAPCQAQITQVAGTLARGKSVLEFYEAAVVNPDQVIILSSEIRTLFAGSPTRYKGLSNDLAQKMKWFNDGPLGLEHIELKPEVLPDNQYGYYSITLKKLNFKQCKALSNKIELSKNFYRVELNGNSILVDNASQQAVAVCKSEWFFQDGKNELKYIGN